MTTKKKPTREEMITEIVDSMDSWDSDMVLEWAKDHMRLELNEYSKDDLVQEYLANRHAQYSKMYANIFLLPTK